MKKDVKKKAEPIEITMWENARPGLAFAGGACFIYGLQIANNPFMAGLGIFMAVVGAVRIEITDSE